MRVAVVGASGNVGTAVLRALRERPEVTSVVAVARRVPDQDTEPYDSAEWASIDIAAASQEDEAVARLTEVFDGADAVIHLAWLIQPNTQRDLLRRVNVQGTRRVAKAVAAAGVRTLVVASSVGVYSPDDTHAARDESWPRRGTDSSHYSVDKVAQEDVLDAFERRHPEITVTRLRPALIFQSGAGSEIQRYFLARWLPVHLLEDHRLPFLPAPSSLRIQAVHADDVARAYAAAAVMGRPGAFNICADDVLDMEDLARLLDHGRHLPVPAAVLRAALWAGHATGLVAADAGWIDMAMAAPVMDNSRARELLGFQPQHTAAEALTELVDGMARGDGEASSPLRPRGAMPASVDEDASGATPTSSVPDGLREGLLGLYLADHLTGAQAGMQRVERMASSYQDTPIFDDIAVLADEIRSEYQYLAETIDTLGLSRRRWRQFLSGLVERAGRLKLNGRVTRRSPMTLLLETELMRSAVVGKRGVWQTLAEIGPELGLDPSLPRKLVGNVSTQLERLERIHDHARATAFREGDSPYPHEDGPAEQDELPQD